MVNFKISDDKSDYWSKYEDVIRLYNKGLPYTKIVEKLSLSSRAYNILIKNARENKRIKYRRKYKKRVKKHDEPRYYSLLCNKKGYMINKGSTYFGTCKTENQAKEIVKKLKECNWNKNKFKQIKKEVINGVEI